MTYIDAINRDFETHTLQMLSALTALKKQLEVLESLNLQEKITSLESRIAQASDLTHKIKLIESLAQEKQSLKEMLAQVEQPHFELSTQTNDDSTNAGVPIVEEKRQVKKVQKRVATWIHKYFAGLNPCNGTILVRFLELSAQNTRPVKRYELEESCKDVSNFITNYHNMRNMLPTNHGKVFEEEYGEITLWQPVADIVLEAYNRARDSRHLSH
ncbi:hypothetical protein ACWIWK_05460 [Helicobacter sp. 23-1048]